MPTRACQLSCGSCSRLTRTRELMKLSCKLSLVNSHATLVLVWPGHESWWDSHANSRLSTLMQLLLSFDQDTRVDETLMQTLACQLSASLNYSLSTRSHRLSFSSDPGFLRFIIWICFLRCVHIEMTNLLPEETMATTIDVDVDELCTKTVASKPITTPATGFDNTDVSVNTSPAFLPPRRRNAELRKLSEQMKRYKRPRRRAIFIRPLRTRRTFPPGVNSKCKRKFWSRGWTKSCVYGVVGCDYRVMW